MESLIKDIYEQLQETGCIRCGRAESEKAVEQITDGLLKKMFLDKEAIRDELYGLAVIAERNGFYAGFRYAVNLMMECRN